MTISVIDIDRRAARPYTLCCPALTLCVVPPRTPHAVLPSYPKIELDNFRNAADVKNSIRRF